MSRFSKYLIVILFLSLAHNVGAQKTCCYRIVGTQIAGPPERAREAKNTWDSVFTSRMYGGGPYKCPGIEMSGGKTNLEYQFVGTLTVEETPRMKSSTLHMQLVDMYRGTAVKEDQITWHCVDWRSGACDQTQHDNIMTLAKSFHSLDQRIYDYERIPERATVVPEKERIMAGKEMTIHLRNIVAIVGKKEESPQSWQRILVKAEKGEILNGTPKGEYRVFKADSPIDLEYQAPKECKKDTETISVYNTCVIDPQQKAMPEREIATKDFEIYCVRGYIDYYYHYVMQHGSAHNSAEVKAQIPFFVNIYEEPPTVEGEAVLSIKGKGHSRNCISSFTGSIPLKLDGKIEDSPDKQPLLQVSLTRIGRKHQTTLTHQCRDKPPKTSIVPALSCLPKRDFTFPLVDGHKIEGTRTVGSTTSTWTLTLRLPEEMQ